jgi:ribulose-phosphate 3-epimerase
MALKGGRKVLIAPSILNADALAIGESIKSLGGEDDWIHLDVMDGRYVPNLSYGPMMAEALRRGFPGAFVDVHLMAEPAESFLDMFMAARPDTLTIHAEAARHLHRALQVIKIAGIIPGVAINPGTPVALIEPVLHMAGIVLVMAVNPGFGGQSFLPEVLWKIENLAQLRAARSYDFLIESDGGVNAATASMLAASGCDVLVAGTAVYHAADRPAAVRALRESAEAGWRA